MNSPNPSPIQEVAPAQPANMAAAAAPAEASPAANTVPAAHPRWQRLTAKLPGLAAVLAKARRAPRRIAVTAAILALAAGAGFGVRWMFEPAPRAVAGLEKAKGDNDALAARLAAANAEIAAARKAEAAARQALAEARTKIAEAAPAASARVAPALAGSAKAVKTMDCDLSGSKEVVALKLKNCVLTFDGMNGRQR